MFIIEDWSLCPADKNLNSSEPQIFLKGFIYELNKLNVVFITTPILIYLNIADKTAQTTSGDKFILGRPDLKWLKWLKENNYTKYTDLLDTFTSFILN